MSNTMVPESDVQESLLAEVADEFRDRLSRGEEPDIEEYVRRYPQLAGVLRQLLPALAILRLPSSESVGSNVSLTCREPATGFLGDYHLVREIGRGGMGIVYEAEQISLGRRVALKVLPFAAALDPKQLQRFKNEAQAAAHLHHTNIVPVFGVGCERGVHYYAMQFIEGQTLAQLITDLRLQIAHLPNRAESHHDAPAQPATPDYRPGTPVVRSEICNPESPMSRTAAAPLAALSTERPVKSAAYFRTMAILGAQAAEALEHAHQLGIIHRDIKPANLLVDVRGNLWITDFGLAHCQNQAGLTMSGDLVGTLRYMSPEQALAKRVQVDHRTDLYSLGVTLYELVTLEHAFDGRDRQELLRQIAFEEPRGPRRRNKSIPAELETIVLKAMEKEPARRYGTAQELADDLKRWLAGEPIRARPVNTWQRAVKWIRRRPAVAGLLAASGVAVLALLGLGVGVRFYAHLQVAKATAEQQREIAEQQRETAERQREEAKRFRYFQHIALAGTAWRDSNMGRLEQLLDECPPDYQHYWEWQYLKRQCHADLLTLEGHPRGGVGSIAFSPDGKRLASGSLDGTVKLWDMVTGREEHTLHGHKDEVFGVAFSPDGKRLASGGVDGTVRLWHAATGREEQRLKAHADWVESVAFSRDGTLLASASFDQTIKVWDIALWRAGNVNPLVHILKGHTGRVYGVAFSPDGKRLASAGFEDQTVKVWDAATGREVFPLKGHTDGVRCVAFSPDGTRLASGSDDRTVKVWDMAEGRAIFALEGHAGGVYSVAFSPDGKRMASGGFDQTVKVWDAATGRETLSLRGHAHVVFALAFSPDGTRLATASQDRTVKFWDATTSQQERTLCGHRGPVAGVAFSPNGEHLASVGMDGTVRLWHTATGQEERKLEGHHGLEGHRGPVAAVAFGADGSQLASAGADKTVKLWDVKAGRVIRDLDHAGPVRSVAFSPDGKWLASADAKGTLKVWDAATGRKLHGLFQAHHREVRSVAFSADGNRVATASADRQVKVWDVATGEVVCTLEPLHACWIHSVAFSPDLTRFASAGEKELPEEQGKPRLASLLASASGDGSVQLWNAITGKHLQSIQGHGNYVRSVAFTRDGTRLVSAADFVRFWDVLTGQAQEVLSLKGHAGNVLGLAFSPDGTRLASASQDGTIKVWDSRPLTPQIALEREALALLDFLFARPLGQADVIELLRESQTIRPEVRQQALAWVDRYCEEADSKRYHQASRDVARQPYLSAFQYRLALRQAVTACRLAPKEESYRTTLGMAQYRADRFQDALTTLTRPEQSKQDLPAELAFLAMTQYRLDQKEQARATLSRLRQVMQEPRWSEDAEMHGFVREAEALIQSR